MKMKKKIASALLLGAVGVSVVGCSNSPSEEKDDKIELSYAFFAPDNTFPAEQMKKFEKEVEKRTDGKVDVQLYTGGTLLQAENMYDGVKNGVADIGLSSPTYEQGKYPLLELEAMPMGIPNSKVGTKVLNDLMKEHKPEAMKDFEVITAFSGEPAYIQSTKDVSSLANLKNQQLRISGSNQDVLSAIQVSPVGMSQSEVPEAIQTAVIDGNVSSREVLKDFQLAEHEKYVLDYPLSTTSFVAVMNESKYNSLPKDVQKVITEVGQEMSDYAAEYHDNQIKDIMDWSKKEQGVKVQSLSAKEKQELDKIYEKLVKAKINDLEDEGVAAQEYYEKMQELIEKHTK